jgi:hypothetical protein
MYSTNDYSISDGFSHGINAYFNSNVSASNGSPISGLAEFPTESNTGMTGRPLLAAQVEAAADFFASTAGFMIGYPTGFAIGVITKTNPLANAALGGAIGQELAPILIQSVVT